MADQLDVLRDFVSGKSRIRYNADQAIAAIAELLAADAEYDCARSAYFLEDGDKPSMTATRAMDNAEARRDAALKACRGES